MDFKVPFTGRAHNYTDEEIEVAVATMKEAVPLTQGRYSKEFEQKFAKYIGAKNCFTTSNATAALELVAQLCQFTVGDEVIIPSHTFTSSAYPFIKKGARIVWADIDKKTRVVTKESIERCITDKTKAIVVAHLYGYVADMTEICNLAKERNILVVEDAAQSLGAELQGQKSGSFGDFGVYSFHSHKNITTLGEGGMLYVKDDQIAKIIPQIRHNGHCGFDFERQDYWIPAMGNVDVPELNGMALMPNNYCLGEVECALGIKLLDRIDEINQQKQNRALTFIDSLKDYQELEFHRVDDKRHNYHLLVARVQGVDRDSLIRHMANDKGVQCVVQYYPLDRYDFYKKLGMSESDCPNADEFVDNMISFPFNHCLSDQDLEYVLQSTKEVIKELRVNV